MRNNIEKREILFEKEIIRITVSIGMCISDGAVEINEMLTVADKCLYNAKQSGKNRITYFQLSP